MTPRGTCTWTEDADGNWYTDCGGAWVFEYRADQDPNMRYCALCGKRIRFVAYEEGGNDETE